MKYPTTPAVLVTNSSFRLDEVSPDDEGPFTDKEDTEKRMSKLRPRLADLQENLYAEHRRSLLLVFQAMDTGGKDGAIEKLLTGVNPAGVQVTPFKAPSLEELNHDFLWRVHAHAPGRGHIGVWNRSHYEDVLITRVHNLIDEKTWTARYQHINQFEELLTANGTTILKFFLHISKKEQAERLQARLDDPAKRWKFDPHDLKERDCWEEYQEAFQDAIANCGTETAPWFVVPADKKWVRDLAIMEIVVAVLEQMNPQPPAATFDVSQMVIKE
jgi:PPK2 family polyphosphate:nucleotide phosphotransferase